MLLGFLQSSSDLNERETSIIHPLPTLSTNHWYGMYSMTLFFFIFMGQDCSRFYLKLMATILSFYIDQYNDFNDESNEIN